MTKHTPLLTPLLLRPADAAAYLSVSETTLATLGIPRRQLRDRIVRYDRRDLDRFADALRDADEAGEESASAWGAA